MRLLSLEVQNYRNIRAARLEPGRELTVICGNNGQGKTNLLEAIWLLTGGKSFRGGKDAELVRRGETFAVLEAVTTGEKGILIAGVDYNAYSSMKKGEPLNIYYPASGTVVNPRPAMILKTAPNMDNAKAFVDFLFSDEAQKLVADAYLLPGRSDVQCENCTNLSDIPQIPTDWAKMMDVASDTAAKLNSICK